MPTVAWLQRAKTTTRGPSSQTHVVHDNAKPSGQHSDYNALNMRVPTTQSYGQLQLGHNNKVHVRCAKEQGCCIPVKPIAQGRKPAKADDHPRFARMGVWTSQQCRSLP